MVDLIRIIGSLSREDNLELISERQEFKISREIEPSLLEGVGTEINI